MPFGCTITAAGVGGGFETRPYKAPWQITAGIATWYETSVESTGQRPCHHLSCRATAIFEKTVETPRRGVSTAVGYGKGRRCVPYSIETRYQ
jgi:hypothetical protein